MSEFDSSVKSYTASIDGYYSVVGQITWAIPTGEFETVKNPNRKLFQFWKPKFVQKEKFRFEVVPGGRKVVFLKAGESYNLEFPHRIEGPK